MAKTQNDNAAMAKPGRRRHWVGTWYGSPQQSSETSQRQSYRMIVHTALGGRTTRLRFSNRYGHAPLVLDHVSLARSSGNTAERVPGTARRVLFRGRTRIIIPAGAERRSDAVRFTTPGDSNIAVSFDAPKPVRGVTAHAATLSVNYATAPGDTGHADEDGAQAFTHAQMPWVFLTGLEVTAKRQASTVVALGDSITDGVFQAPNSNGRWPDLLNDRIRTSPRWRGLRSVVNAGISGNMVTADRDGNALQGQAAVTRMAWDVLRQPNVSHLILFEGINDVGEGVKGPKIVAGLRRIEAMARRRGITVIRATLTPSLGALAYGQAYHSNQSARNVVNHWVRRGPRPIIDFSASVATPTTPESWRPDYTADFLHPNPVGLMVMARAVPLSTLQHQQKPSRAE